jgi:hypothetical protein
MSGGHFSPATTLYWRRVMSLALTQRKTIRRTRVADPQKGNAGWGVDFAGGITCLGVGWGVLVEAGVGVARSTRNIPIPASP